jgi:hypothetical protein
MKTLFICLANSKKFGERCIAGIEVRKTGSTYYPIKKRRKAEVDKTYLEKPKRCCWRGYSWCYQFNGYNRD